ncbi:MAG: putative sulfate exporter family transporter [Candidatus Sericytochromatia bacterium]|nr:putative sulfate exporter family transporter [Candidatus Sericytochromatia bacterium]
MAHLAHSVSGPSGSPSEPASPTGPVAPRGKLPGFLLAFGLAAAGYAGAQLKGLAVMGPLSLALLIGIAWRSGVGVSPGLAPGVRFSSKPLLRAGIVLMGARLDYGVLLAAGPKLLGIAVSVISVAIIGMYALARRVGLPRELGMLMAVGTGICGASAVAAASTVTRASEEDTTLAVALMGLLGTAGVFFYVGLAPWLGLSPQQLGIITGATLHEVAQVVAAAFTWGELSGDAGTMVKLTRVVLLAPALVLVGWYWRRATRHEAGHAAYSLANPPIPYFVLGFLAVGALNSLGLFSETLRWGLTQASIGLMAIAMAAMGLLTDLRQVRQAGLSAIAVGVVGFLTLFVMVYAMIRLLHV